MHLTFDKTFGATTIRREDELEKLILETEAFPVRQEATASGDEWTVDLQDLSRYSSSAVCNGRVVVRQIAQS